MKNIIYPAIFHKEENGGYWVEFPDLPGCLTSAATVDEALLMAGDALYAWLNDETQKAVAPTNASDIKVDGDDFTTLVKAEAYASEEAVKFRAKMEIENGLEERKLNMSQAAQILDIDRSYFTYIMNGKKTPSPDLAKRIGLLLNFDWRVFYATSASY